MALTAEFRRCQKALSKSFISRGWQTNGKVVGNHEIVERHEKWRPVRVASIIALVAMLALASVIASASDADAQDPGDERASPEQTARLSPAENETQLSRCFPGRADYTQMYWADGFEGRSPEGDWRRVIQTGHYAMVLDIERMKISHLGTIAGPLSYRDAARQDNSAWSQLPSAQLELQIDVDGVTYRCVRGGRATDHDGPRLIESGLFAQRADVTRLVFEAADGRQLQAESRFETLAWPARLNLLLEVAPALTDIPAGNTFGRVGGGFGFDGANHLDTTLTAAETPSAFSLACWAYLPPDFHATQYDAWLICGNGNEWADGHFGIVLSRSGALGPRSTSAAVARTAPLWKQHTRTDAAEFWKPNAGITWP